MLRIISKPNEPVPTYVVDTKKELADVVKEQQDSNMIGICALCLED